MVRMWDCENCGVELNRSEGIYDGDFGFVCFNCYEDIRKVFDLKYLNYSTCKDCGKELTNLNIETEYCPKCLFKEIDETERVISK